MPLLQPLLLDKIIPSILQAATTLVIILVILKLFRVKNPATRFIFLFLPLVKALIDFIEGGSWHPHVDFQKHFWLSARFDDPLGVFKAPIPKDFDLPGTFTIKYSIIVLGFWLAVISIIIVLVARWVQLFLFLNSFKKEERLSRSGYPQIYATLDRLVGKFKVRQPELVITKKYQFVPFSVGYRVPIIVLTKDLIDNFSKEQLEIMLAHELAHIRRYDNFTSWASLILRDLLFFNPMSYPIYRMIEEEKEKACDRIALEKTGISAKAIANTLLDVAIFRKRVESAQKVTYPALSKGFLHRFLYRKSALERRVNSITKQEPGGASFLPLCCFKGALVAFAIIAILLIHPIVAIIAYGRLVLILR